MDKPVGRAERKLAFVKAQMRRGDCWVEITIGNVSSSGLMAKGAPPPEVGTEIEIRRRGITIVGEVTWASRTRFGMKSFHEIDTSALLTQSVLQPGRRVAAPAVSSRQMQSRWLFWQQR